jgi:hypothetical protein
LRWWLLLLLLPACLVDSRATEAADALGPEVGDVGPEHRPGQPCLVCHSSPPGDGRGDLYFALAGTVYRRVDDETGAFGLFVEVTDADGEQYVVETNLAGNFAFALDPSVDGVVDDGDGIARVARAPRFPLRVRLSDGVRDQEMETQIQREGSCNACHAPEPSATSVGKIYFVEEEDTP